MPKPTLDVLKTRETGIRKRLSGEGLAPDRLRGLKKRLRRTQRRRRKLVTQIARMAPKKSEAGGA